MPTKKAANDTGSHTDTEELNVPGPNFFPHKNLFANAPTIFEEVDCSAVFAESCTCHMKEG